jgi:hypothetical protein
VAKGGWKIGEEVLSKGFLDSPPNPVTNNRPFINLFANHQSKPWTTRPSSGTPSISPMGQAYHQKTGAGKQAFAFAQSGLKQPVTG